MKPDGIHRPHGTAASLGDGIEIEAETLRRWLEEGNPVEVVDIRPAADYQSWHIPGARNLDAYNAIYARSPGPLADYEAPDGLPVVTVCYVGATSRIASEYLRTKGIPAHSLAGGMQAWSLAWNTAEVPLPNSQATVIQVRRTGKGCLSYLVGSKGDALVIDASVDPQIYLDLADSHGWRITKVVDTHVHADHLTRGIPLANAAGADYLLPDQDRVQFDHRRIRTGDVIEIGGARLKALQTPGHTFESMSFELGGAALFTGDTLFLDSVGRPDLKADPAEARARSMALHRSLNQIKELDPGLLVLPCHSSQPLAFDGAPLMAPLGEIVARVEALALDEAEFVDWILSRLPANPPNHEVIVQLNEVGRLPGAAAAQLEAGANRCAI